MDATVSPFVLVSPHVSRLTAASGFRLQGPPRLPPALNPKVCRGRRLVDAAVFEPVPFRAAVAEGCTHVITLCSRPLGSK